MRNVVNYNPMVSLPPSGYYGNGKREGGGGGGGGGGRGRIMEIMGGGMMTILGPD